MTCPNCGNDIPNNAEFCPKCGANIQDANIKKRKLERRNKIGFGITKVLYVILLFPLIITLGVSIIFLVVDITAYIHLPLANPLGTDFVVEIAFVIVSLGSILFIFKRLLSKK